MANGDAWRTPAGDIGVEINRRTTSQGDLVIKVLRTMASPWWLQACEYGSGELTPERSRYEGARGGRAGGADLSEATPAGPDEEPTAFDFPCATPSARVLPTTCAAGSSTPSDSLFTAPSKGGSGIGEV
ncbi:hypothetical protein SAMN05421778_11478 [Sphaerotilus natans]|uniref:hypothetical protein n=1 Tax=Sphaerotilus natans TaxID=34103 RepID=UPI00055EF892|nr:hypothetical protein [Sphaerotilus natans]SIR68181.1 hypothetical protein SAMN05421778_11478 [Sphaerotilus natans]